MTRPAAPRLPRPRPKNSAKITMSSKLVMANSPTASAIRREFMVDGFQSEGAQLAGNASAAMRQRLKAHSPASLRLWRSQHRDASRQLRRSQRPVPMDDPPGTAPDRATMLAVAARPLCRLEHLSEAAARCTGSGARLYVQRPRHRYRLSGIRTPELLVRTPEQDREDNHLSAERPRRTSEGQTRRQQH